MDRSGSLVHPTGNHVRNDPDDGIGFPVDPDGLTEDSRIAAKTGLPKLAADDGDMVPAVYVLGFRKQTSQNGADPQQLKVGSRHQADDRLFGLIGTENSADVLPPVVIDDQSFEAVSIRGKIPHVQYGRAARIAYGHPVLRGPDPYESIGFGEWQRPQQCRVHRAKNHRVGADAESQNQDGDDLIPPRQAA